MSNVTRTAQRLVEQPALAILHEDRCLLERDLNATCSACADACPTEAITLGASRAAADAAAGYGSVAKDGPAGPRINDEACVRCGRCVTACPTGALLPLPPNDDDALLAAIERAGVAAAARTTQAGDAADNAGEIAARTTQAGDVADDDAGEAAAPLPTAGFACERTAETVRLDAERTVVLPCLAWLDEAALVHMACSGAQRIAVLTAPCSTCDHADVLRDLPAMVKSAQRILDVWSLGATVEITAFAAKDIVAVDDASAVGEVSRRALFSQAGSSLLDAATEAATTRVRSFVGRPSSNAKPDPTPDRRRWQLLDDLHAAELPERDTRDTNIVPRSLSPRVDIDTQCCSGCTLCSQFCPTGALRKVGKASGGKTLLEFDATLCRDCGVCTDTCRYEAITREEALSAAELFTLEPRTITIPKRRVLPNRR